MSFSHKVRAGVLRGGPSAEYEVSLNTGKTILANLPDEYEPLDILISKEGVWHIGGLEKNPHDILKSVDVVVNAMHGGYGEDGTVQKFLEDFGVPYTGSNSLASALGMNKIMAKNIFSNHGLKTPHHIAVAKDEDNNDSVISRHMLDKINENLIFPIIIKPVSSGSSLGVSFVESIGQVKEALKNSFRHAPKLLVEEYINGKEVTCGVIEGFRGQNFYTLLPIEIQTPKGIFYDHDSKYNISGNNLESKYQIPGNLTDYEKKQIAEATILAHQILGLRHYSRSDFILHPKRGLFTLEVNTLPELSHRSSFIKSLEATGSNIREFLSHLLSKTLNKI